MIAYISIIHNAMTQRLAEGLVLWQTRKSRSDVVLERITVTAQGWAQGSVARTDFPTTRGVSKVHRDVRMSSRTLLCNCLVCKGQGRRTRNVPAWPALHTDTGIHDIDVFPQKIPFCTQDLDYRDFSLRSRPKFDFFAVQNCIFNLEDNGDLKNIFKN